MGTVFSKHQKSTAETGCDRGTRALSDRVNSDRANSDRINGDRTSNERINQETAMPLEEEDPGPSPAPEEVERPTTPQIRKPDDEQMLSFRKANSAIDGLESPRNDSGTTTTLENSPSMPKYHLDNTVPRDFLNVESALAEGLHPATREQVFEKLIIRDRPVLKIVCPLLIGELHKVTGCLLDDSSLTSSQLTNSLTTTLDGLNKPFLPDRRVSDVSEHAKFTLASIKATSEKPDIQISDESEIAFNRLPLLYPPRSTIFTKDGGGWRAYRVERVELGHRPGFDMLEVHAFYLDFDKTGKWLVPQSELLAVPPYSSMRRIRDLELVPDWYILKTCRSLTEGLVERGKRFWTYRNKPVCQVYTGDVWPTTLDTEPLRVIIDNATSSKHGEAPTSSHLNSYSCPICLGETLNLGPYGKGIEHDPDVCIRNRQSQGGDRESGSNNERLLMFCPPRLRAFSLIHRTWGMVQLRHLEDVKYRPVDRNKVYLDSDGVELLDAQVASYFKDSKEFQDSSDRQSDVGSASLRKHLGLNVLLQGEPGTGKTFVVEYLADKHEKPLYVVSCGHLGTEPDIVGERLREILLQAANWRIVLLLEEANFFLPQRESFDIRYCALLSVFRYQLEQSEALVFMTATRCGNPDPYFTSRMGCALGLPPLTRVYQKEIWNDMIVSLNPPTSAQLKNFISKGLATSDGKEVWNMNGREIQACFRAALALAKQSGESLTESHIKRVLQLAQEFEDFVRRTSRVDRNGAVLQMWTGKDK